MDLNLIWKNAADKLATNIDLDADIKNDYLPFCELHKIKDGSFVVLVKSNLGAAIMRQNAHIIKDELSSFLKSPFSVDFLTMDEFSKISYEVQNQENLNTFKSTFENFVHGKSNNQAFIAAKIFAENNDSSTFNPLFIYGDSGLGKTHLLESIVNFVVTKNKKNKVLFLNADEFTNAVVSVINSGEKNIEDFKNKILENDFFIIDDVHFLTKRDKTNEFLFFIINSFLESGKKLAFSSDKNPEALNGFERRMITRFNSGLSVCIEPLDIDTAENILNLRILEFNLSRVVSKAAVHFLAENFCDDARKIKGLVNRLELLTLSNDSKGEVSLEEVLDFFKLVPSSSLGALNVKKIKEVVGNKYGVSPKAIDGKARTTAIKNARHVSMYFAKTILNHTSTQIGSEFGGRDHSTVLSAIARIEKDIYVDKNFKKVIASLKNKILN